MRALNKDELTTLFSKLAKYIGGNVKLLLERSDGTYCFRLNHGRVYYMKETILKKASCIAKKNLMSLGACFGKFTKSNQFHLHITALDYIAPYAMHKIWLKSNAEQQFLYGHHTVKSGVARISDSVNQYDGVILFNMSDVPLGFGVASKSSTVIAQAEPGDIVCLHQADLG
ncbi:hypothetical protein HZS_6680, partial [Henneguya salminicola]